MMTDSARTRKTETIKEEEEAFWSNVYKKELEAVGYPSKSKQFTSKWWELYYQEIREFVSELPFDSNHVSVLEAGSGSGKASILLPEEKFEITLLDHSTAALDFSRVLARRFDRSKVVTHLGDIFSLPYEDQSFDFCWNIGVAEHYEDEDISDMLVQMIRVTKKKGWILVAVPNFLSLPIIKARILTHPWLNFFPGYRLESERDVRAEKLRDLFLEAISRTNRSVQDSRTVMVGSYLPMETPATLLQWFERKFGQKFANKKFLCMVAIRVA